MLCLLTIRLLFTDLRYEFVLYSGGRFTYISRFDHVLDLTAVHIHAELGKSPGLKRGNRRRGLDVPAPEVILPDSHSNVLGPPLQRWARIVQPELLSSLQLGADSVHIDDAFFNRYVVLTLDDFWKTGSSLNLLVVRARSVT